MRRTPLPVTLRQLQYLVAVEEARSFRGAAALCHVAQPSLSSQVAQAEDALGVRVFERDRRRVLVTAAGGEILRRAREILVAADDLADAGARLADPLRGTLRIGVIPTIAPYLLPETAPALRRELPRLEVLWIEERTAGVVARLQAGELDAGLVAEEAELGDLERGRIGWDPFVVAAGPGHPLAASAAPVDASRLDAADLLLLADGHCLRDQAIAACGRSGSRKGAFSATSLSTLAQVVAGGAGITLLPGIAVAIENRTGTLRIRPFRKPAPGRTLVLAWRRGSPAARGLARVAEVMRSAFSRGSSRGRAGR